MTPGPAAPAMKRSSSLIYRTDGSRRVPLSMNCFSKTSSHHSQNSRLPADDDDDADLASVFAPSTPVRSRSAEFVLPSKEQPDSPYARSQSPFRSYLPFAPLNNIKKKKEPKAQRRASNGRNDCDDDESSHQVNNGNDASESDRDCSPPKASRGGGTILGRRGRRRRRAPDATRGLNDDDRDLNNLKVTGNLSNSTMLSEEEEDEVSLGSFNEDLLAATTPRGGQKQSATGKLSASYENLSASCGSLVNSARRRVAQIAELSLSNLSVLTAPELSDGGGSVRSSSSSRRGGPRKSRNLYSIRKSQKMAAQIQEFVAAQTARRDALQYRIDNAGRLARARHANGSTTGAVLAMRKVVGLRAQAARVAKATDVATEALSDLQQRIARAQEKWQLLQERKRQSGGNDNNDVPSRRNKSYKIDLGPHAHVLDECHEILEGDMDDEEDDRNMMDDATLLQQLEELQ